MEIVKNNTSELEGTLTIKVNEQDYAEKVEKQLKQLRKKLNLKGFRPGQVPLQVVKKLYGDSVLIEEVQKLIDEEIEKFLKENNWKLVGSLLADKEKTKFDIKKDKDFEFVYQYGKYPELDINLEDLELTYYKVKITDELIDKRIEELRNKYGELIEVEQVNENVSVYVDATELDENNQPKENGIKVENGLILIKYLTDEGKKLFDGKKKDEEVIAEDIKKVFANKTDMLGFLRIKEEELEKISPKFSFKINKIQEFKPAEINEDFFKKVFGDKVTNEEEMHEEIRKQLEKEYEDYELGVFTLTAEYELVNKFDIQLPESFIEKYYGKKPEEASFLAYFLKAKYLKDILGEKINFEFKFEDFEEELLEKYLANFALLGIDVDIDAVKQDEKQRKAILESILKSMSEKDLEDHIYESQRRAFFKELKNHIKLKIEEKELEEIEKIVKEILDEIRPKPKDNQKDEKPDDN